MSSRRIQKHSLLKSFRFRLTLWFVLILAVILGVFSLFIYFRQAQVLRAETISQLQSDLNQLSTYYGANLTLSHEVLEGDSDHQNTDVGNLPLLQEYDRLAYLDRDGKVIQQSEHFAPDDLQNVYQLWVSEGKSDAPVTYEFSSSNDHEHRSRDNTYLFVGTALEVENQSFGTLLLGSPIDPGAQQPRLALVLGFVYFLTLAVAFGGGFWLANQAMRPVQTITRTARSLSEHDLNKRLNLSRSDELGELAATFDQMLDRLQAAFERQRQFTADASHELRTPLTIIELEAERALEKPRNSKEYQKSLAIIQSENEWMSRLVGELLTLARLDSGRAALRREEIDLSEVGLDVIDRLLPLAQRHQVALKTGELQKALVFADRDYITHIVVNLVENGIHYHAGDAPTVTVETGETARNGKTWAWVRVVDNGRGIPEEHLPHLFDRFYRVDEARSREEENDVSIGGSGLGLAIVHSITQLLGGEVEVQSRLGEGTTFTVWLPAQAG